jgi:hypothetical protein
VITREMLEQRVKDLETRYLNLTNEMQIVLGAMNESKMLLKYLVQETAKYANIGGMVDKLEKAIEDAVERPIDKKPVEADAVKPHTPAEAEELI